MPDGPRFTLAIRISISLQAGKGLDALGTAEGALGPDSPGEAVNFQSLIAPRSLRFDRGAINDYPHAERDGY